MTDQTPVRPRVPLAEQIDEVARELRQRARVYPRLIEKGRLKLETATEHNVRLEAALATLRLLADNQDWIRPELTRRLAAKRAADELAADLDTLKDHPAVAAVRETFPDATVTDVRPLSPTEETTTP